MSILNRLGLRKLFHSEAYYKLGQQIFYNIYESEDEDTLYFSDLYSTYTIIGVKKNLELGFIPPYTYNIQNDLCTVKVEQWELKEIEKAMRRKDEAFRSEQANIEGEW